MKTVYPKNKKDENFFKRLSKYPVYETKDIIFTRTLPRRYNILFDNGFLKIKRNLQTRESAVYLPEGIKIAPMNSSNSRRTKFSKFGFFRGF